MITTSPVLPGTPTSIGERSASARLASLLGVNQILIATQATIFEPESLGQEALDLIPYLLWNESDGAECLRDAAKQYLSEQHRCVKAIGHNFGWSADGWVIERHEVPFKTQHGMTACWLEVDPRDNVLVCFYDDMRERRYLRNLTDEETEALQAYVWHVVV